MTRVETFLLKERRPKVLGPLGLLGILLWLVPLGARYIHVSPMLWVAMDFVGIVGYLFIALRLFLVSLYSTVAMIFLLAPYFFAITAIVQGRDLTGSPAFWYCTAPLSMIGVVLFLRMIALTRKKPNQSPDPTTRSVTPPAGAGDRAAAGRGSS